MLLSGVKNHNRFSLIFFFCLFAICPLFATQNALIEHVKESLEKGNDEYSALSIKALKVEGMTSSKVRHFLNNICSLEGASYLEIGCWKGATLISSLFANSSTFDQVIAIDNWSEWGGPKNEFIKNISNCLPEIDFSFDPKSTSRFKFIEADCFLIDKSIFSIPINIYFYDGAHDSLSQELAFTYFNDVFEDVFIAIIDDWNEAMVRVGTFAAFDKLKYTILFEKELFTPKNGDNLSWWNGLYIAVIKK